MLLGGGRGPGRDRLRRRVPIETIALEVASSNEPLRLATAEVFESWTVAARERFESAGLDAATARVLAITTISLLEGAFILCRSTRTTEALELT